MLQQASKDRGMRDARHYWLRRSGMYVGWLALCFFLVACHQDMYNQPKYTSYQPSDFFDDGRSSRPPVPNTVALGQFRTDSVYFTGRTAEGDFAVELPFPLTAEVMERGQTRYDAFCMPCHGVLGDGQGLIAQRGPLTVPSFHSQRLREASVGYYYDVITNGFGVMYSYAARIPVEDRWAITAYVRALQLSQNAPLADVDPAERANLEEGQ